MVGPRHNELPEDPRFYERVLEHLPSPVIVVRADTTIAYGNRSMRDMSGWSLDDGIGMPMLEVIHPDDRAFVTETFAGLLDAAGHDRALDRTAWSPVRFRIITRSGAVIPIEATGLGGFVDPIVDGVIVNIRDCRSDELLAEVFRGVASHDPVGLATPPLVERLALPPGELAVAVFEQHADGSARCVAASDDLLATLPVTSTAAVPWIGLVTSPSQVDLDALPDGLGTALRDAGFLRCFHAGAHAPDFATTLRIVACCTTEDGPSQGLLTKIAQARELLALIVGKAYNDRVIADNAMRDELTGLPNRFGLTHRFDRLVASGDDCAVMFVDIDDFKQINDRYGHAAGDSVLAAVADRLVRTVRADDFVCRIGGDEFVVVLVDAHGRLHRDIVHDLAARVVAILSEPVTHNGESIDLAVSVGVAFDRSNDLDRLLDRADGAMYRAKRAGGDRHHLDIDSAA